MILKLLTLFKKVLSTYRNIVFKDYRANILSKTICNEIERLENLKKKKIIKILDFGSGYDPIVITKIVKNLSYKYKSVKFLAYCYDFYTEKNLKIMNNNLNIKFLNIKNLSSNKTVKFDFCLVIDVLHHIGVKNNRKITEIIKKLKKRSKFLIIKDHFQYGFFSNLTLKIMDFIGNYGDNVKVARIYFSTKAFDNFLSKLKLVELKRIDNKKYYKWFWFYFNSKKFQFISIIK